MSQKKNGLDQRDPIMKKGKKLELHQSNLKNYFSCPKKFFLSLNFQPELKPSTQNVMREGRIFESLVFGEKLGTKMEDLIGKKKTETIEKINEIAKKVIPIFKSGEKYVDLKFEEENYVLAGEADYIGEVEYTNEFGKRYKFNKCIADLKKTGDIPRLWDHKYSKDEYLQAIMYVYIYFKMFGEILPFVYIVVEDTYKDPIILCRPIIIKETDFKDWYLPFINKVIDDMFYEAEATETNCVKGDHGARCWYLPLCKQGRSFIGKLDVVEFKSLFDNQGYE